MSGVSSVKDFYKRMSYSVYTYIIYVFTLFLFFYFSLVTLVTLAMVQHNKFSFGITLKELVI